MEKSKLQEADCAATDTAAWAATAFPPTVDNMPRHQFLGGQGRGLHGRAVTMEDLASYVENRAERPVIDKTGMPGLYRVETEPWMPMRVGPTPPADTKGENGALLSDLPTLFEVFDRMGLRLDSEKATVDVFRIAGVAEPSGN